ncbi:hypothetical protein [Streptomyces sp. NPDC056188]|uniref:hypothetical protein n=1 Tax=Streptomyces sp. NPDC056188 TaxID=3345740 RepID=UPI0035E0AD46
MFFLILTMVFGVVGASAVGLAGTQGVFTADECHTEGNGKGGKSTTCSGVFVSHDGSLVDREARISWSDGRAGAHTQVRTVLLGGYQREDGLDVILMAVLVPVMGLVAVGCAFAGLSRATQDRLALRLPGPAFAVYVEWWY